MPCRAWFAPAVVIAGPFMTAVGGIDHVAGVVAIPERHLADRRGRPVLRPVNQGTVVVPCVADDAPRLAHPQPVAWLAVGALSSVILVRRTEYLRAGGLVAAAVDHRRIVEPHLRAPVRSRIISHYAPRLRLAPVEDGAHHRRAEKDWALFSFAGHRYSFTEAMMAADCRFLCRWSAHDDETHPAKRIASANAA